MTSPRAITPLLQHTVAIKDAKLTARVLSGPVMEAYDGTQNEALATAFPTLPATKTGELLQSFFEGHAKNLPGPCIALWLRLAAGDLLKPTALKSAAEVLITNVALAESDKQERHPRHFSLSDFPELEGKPAKSPKIDSPLVLAFFQQVAREPFASLLQSVTGMLTRNTGLFDPDRIVVPLLELAAKNDPPLDQTVLRTLWNHCVDHYLARSQQPPAAPKDWALPVNFTDTSPDGKALIAFARDPDVKEKRFPLAKARRQHLHQLIDRHGIEMNHVTERKGSPHTLVCTKNRASYKKACARHKKDIVLLQRLEDLAQSGFPATPDRLAPITAAFKKAKAASKSAS